MQPSATLIPGSSNGVLGSVPFLQRSTYVGGVAGSSGGVLGAPASGVGSGKIEDGVDSPKGAPKNL